MSFNILANYALDSQMRKQFEIFLNSKKKTKSIKALLEQLPEMIIMTE